MELEWDYSFAGNVDFVFSFLVPLLYIFVGNGFVDLHSAFLHLLNRYLKPLFRRKDECHRGVRDFHFKAQDRISETWIPCCHEADEIHKKDELFAIGKSMGSAHPLKHFCNLSFERGEATFQCIGGLSVNFHPVEVSLSPDVSRIGRKPSPLCEVVHLEGDLLTSGLSKSPQVALRLVVMDPRLGFHSRASINVTYCVSAKNWGDYL